VEMPSKEEAEAAINGLNGQDFMGRSLKLSEARPRPERSDGGDRRGGGSRGGREY
jgi:RNA recognition motif-containing protein